MCSGGDRILNNLDEDCVFNGGRIKPDYKTHDWAKIRAGGNFWLHGFWWNKQGFDVRLLNEISISSILFLTSGGAGKMKILLKFLMKPKQLGSISF